MSKNPLHFYRALLRECNYLVDDHARNYFRNYITKSFRRYLPRDRIFPICCPVSEAVVREAPLLQRACKLQSLLQRANNAEVKAFEKVLRLAYGRSGKRRRELIQNLTVKSDNDTVKPYGPDWKPPAILMGLMSSQAKQQRHLKYTNRNLQVRGPQIPSKNTWGRPFPQRRAKNVRHKWYARNVNTVYPPLPEEEWQRIKAIAFGEEKMEGSGSRRPRATRAVLAEENTQDRTRRHNKIDQGAASPNRKIRARFVRRQMMKLLNHVPKPVTHTDDAKAAIYKWEGSTTVPFAISEAVDAQTRALFD